jgi:hypothetical protein
MKLEANISPRRDGTVKAEFGKITYVFAEDEHGRLVADIGVDEHIAELLNTGNFIPADEEDFEIAAAIAAPPVDDDAGEEDFEMQGGTDVDPDSIPAAPPVEENTPPSLRKPRKAK